MQGSLPLVVQRDQHIRRFDITVDNPLRMSVLDHLAHWDEQFKPFARRQFARMAKRGDRRPFD